MRIVILPRARSSEPHEYRVELAAQRGRLSMRRSVRNRITGEYLAVVGGWTREEALAVSFSGVEEAFSRCRELRLTDVEYVVRFELGEPEVVVPIPNPVG